ncbi:hypothetical protein [Micrococcus sp. TA1]|uniref:hypothetical protein n=1 Tax=Micrococcus sp. TA1 TaxID=681627 RepID=UPI00160E80C0|nr:hypothetical protein [Micrococcus sp. TA1]MBB5748555.1 hypothetical protein [Micrococcus sp. TA1]
MTIRAELDNMRERVEGTTEGPWEVDADDTRQIRTAGDGYWIASLRATYEDEPTRISNAEFIAHARTDLPRLLDALDAVYAELIEMDKSRDGILGRREIGPDEAATARTLGVVEARLSIAITTALEGK